MIQGFGFRVWGFGFRASGFGFRVSGFGHIGRLCGLLVGLRVCRISLGFQRPPFTGGSGQGGFSAGETNLVSST